MISGNVPVISAGVSPSGYHNKSNVLGTSVTISSSGANAGFISIHYEDIWAADCSFISEESTKYIYYVYEVLNNMRAVVDNLQRGAAQPHVYPKDINRITIVVPDENIRAKANEKFYQLHKMIANLLQQNIFLSRQRDLLLPRLMSGKLEVKA
jgi:type I restriction enzyme S subunit